jgi:SAM-dependent methyltransferase
MTVPPVGYKSSLAYLIWRWLLRNKGQSVSELDAYFFGPSRGFNDYEALATTYNESGVKPDKLYSILPTVLGLVGNCLGKVVFDLGCGAGYFTVPIAELGATQVYGIDNSRVQLTLAVQNNTHPSVAYALSDFFVDRIPHADIMVAPFVANYARTTPILQNFFRKAFKALRPQGKIVLVVDLPNRKELRRFGATKKLLGPPTDEEIIEIKLFREEREICKLLAVYYTGRTIERLLSEVGFRNIVWHRPIISDVGIKTLGQEFWQSYLDDPELGYLTAQK